MGENNTKDLVKNPGRPTVITPEIIGKLESIFKLGVKDELAINYAGIASSTYYDHLDKDDVFRSKMQAAKDYARIAAGSVVMDAIVKDKDVQTAKWWLEKKCPDEFDQQPQVLQQIQVNVIPILGGISRKDGRNDGNQKDSPSG